MEDYGKLLQEITFGSRVAEEESSNLKKYFVKTGEWKRVFGKQVDVIYGPKGSGKSAIYSLLQESADELFDNSILYIGAENPRGATAFVDIVTDPPTSQREFEQLWKLYFASLAAGVFDEYGLKNDAAKEMTDALKQKGLLVGKESLSDKFRMAFRYVRKYVRPSTVEASLKLDPVTSQPVGYSAKLGFDTSNLKETGEVQSSDELLKLANHALAQSKYRLWISVDRLDVAFQEHPELEANALRALFKVYLDMFALDEIRLIIFLRTDIWKRITESGFREASHITKTLTISWTKESLLNLILRRLLQSDFLARSYGVSTTDVLDSFDNQQDLFYRIFPEQIDVGEKKPNTLDWMLSRTRDGTGHNAPRELIHLLNESKENQMKQIDIGREKPEKDNLFSRAAIKEALKPVSKVRLEQTLYAEYPHLKKLIQDLEGEKATQRTDSLAKIWSCSPDEARMNGDALAEVGFFEKRGKDDPLYWIPFLYREALSLVQGEAE